MPDKPSVPKKFGGIDTKWWLVGGLGAGGVAYIMYARSSAPSDTTTSNDPTATTDPSLAGTDTTDYGSSDAYGDSGYYTGGGYAGNAYEEQLLQEIAHNTEQPPPPPGQGGSKQKANNRHWLNEAIDALVKAGNHRAAATAALTAYLAGAPLTEKQVAMVESAIHLEGTPPNHAPAIRLADHKPSATDKHNKEAHHPRKGQPQKKHHRKHNASHDTSTLTAG